MAGDIWLNGERWHPSSKEALDRGLLYGDGFFTTMLVVQGAVANWQGHEARLAQSAERLKFTGFDLEACRKDLVQVMQASVSWPDFSVIKVIVTRGTGGKGYQPSEEANYHCYIQVLPFPQSSDVQSLLTSYPPAWQIFRPCVTESSVSWGKQPLLAGLKHLNRLENVLARQALLGTSWDEALMSDIDGRCVSATQANLCILNGNQIFTPSLNESGVQGTALASLAAICQEKGIVLITKSFDLQAVREAEEVFLCNAVRGVMPVRQLEQKALKTGFGERLAEDWVDWTMAHLTSSDMLENG